MKKKITITAMSLLTALFLLPINGFAYTINNEFNLGLNEGSSQVANNQYILLHETANETATGRNEAQYMQRSWTSAYTAYIVVKKHDERLDTHAEKLVEHTQQIKTLFRERRR
ncbi:hypothetical protein [Enterococcus faecium]